MRAGVAAGHPATCEAGVEILEDGGTAADAAYAVTGDAVNTAARLQSAAGAGQTLVSFATHQLTEGEHFIPSGWTTVPGAGTIVRW